MDKRYFTPKEANALLPFIKEDLTRLQETKREFVRTALQLRELRTNYARTSQTPPEDDVFRLEASMEFMQLEAKTLADSIRLKGAELKDVDGGLVDFPAMLNGEEVLLCWKQGEDRIAYYHGRHDGFRGRKPISEEYFS